MFCIFSSDFKLNELFTSTTRLRSFLTNNLSMSASDIDTILNSTVNVKEVILLPYNG